MDSKENLQEFLLTAETLAKECGAIARSERKMVKYGNVFVKDNNSSDVVTEIDRKIEQKIINTLRKKYPSHKYIGEESVDGACKLSDDPTWIIDPIDGTVNFINGLPFAAVCIGLTINKKVVVGVIYNFLLDQLYSAMKGGGAHLNGNLIHVSNCKEQRQALVLTEIGADRHEPDLHSKVSTVHNLTGEPCHILGIRCIGSSALSCCMVADGTADAYIEYEVHCWDFAAGDVIVQEAGGVTLYPTGAPLDLMGRGVLVASSTELAQAMIPYIQHCNYPRDDA